ncbi:MAG: kynureninase, partial [Saprospiraceae bacterium]
LLTSLLVEWDHPSISVITPQNIDENGCQLSIRLRQPDKSIFVALTNQGVIADWREPDVIRIAPVPLYNNFEELITFFNKFKQIVENYG